jgi:hypothetical protein
MVVIMDTHYCKDMSADEKKLVKEILDRNTDGHITTFTMDHYWYPVTRTWGTSGVSNEQRVADTILHAITNNYDVDSLFTHGDVDTTNKPDMDEDEMVNMIESTETNEETDLNEPGVPYHGLTGNEMTKEEWDELMNQYEVMSADVEMYAARTSKADLRYDMETTAKVWYSADTISTELFDKIMNEAKLLCTDDDFYPRI